MYLTTDSFMPEVLLKNSKLSKNLRIQEKNLLKKKSTLLIEILSVNFEENDLIEFNELARANNKMRERLIKDDKVLPIWFV